MSCLVAKCRFKLPACLLLNEQPGWMQWCHSTPMSCLLAKCVLKLPACLLLYEQPGTVQACNSLMSRSFSIWGGGSKRDVSRSLAGDLAGPDLMSRPLSVWGG
eukprot:1270380-Karenia_brevis.AAC.1